MAPRALKTSDTEDLPSHASPGIRYCLSSARPDAQTMGIPHLITTLEPFSVRGTLQDEDIVIDGPALAYHVLHICRRNGIGQPSYSLLGQIALSWLSELCRHGKVYVGVCFGPFKQATSNGLTDR